MKLSDSIGVLCWNTALYQQGNNKAPISWKRVGDVLDFVEEQVRPGGAVAPLQEIPYVSNQTWTRHAVFTELCHRFDPERYDLIYNISSPRQILMTAVLAPKGVVCRKQTNFDSNRKVTVALAGSELSVLTLHAANGQYNRPDILSLQRAEASLLAGDFNAGDYAGSENRDAFRSLLNTGYHDACGGEATTVYGTPIDHVLARDPRNVQNLRVHSDVRFSDHFPITFDLVL